MKDKLRKIDEHYNTMEDILSKYGLSLEDYVEIAEGESWKRSLTEDKIMLMDEDDIMAVIKNMVAMLKLVVEVR